LASSLAYQLLSWRGLFSIDLPPVGFILSIIALPILLILFNTFLNSPLAGEKVSESVKTVFGFIGHPFVALILANLAVWFGLGRLRGMPKEKLFEISSKSMAPAGIIILLTGAGGVFKEMLIDVGAGKMLAEYFASIGFSTMLFAFVAAATIRILQGSATVAMITAAGMTAPLVLESTSQSELALLVIAIASGATIFSHVNDSGFWLVKQYLHLNEKQTFRSWTVMTTIIAFVGIITVHLLALFF